MVRRLKSWLKKPGNTYAKMAELLGVKSRTNVCNWVFRGKIPKAYTEKLKEVLDAGI